MKNIPKYNKNEFTYSFMTHVTAAVYSTNHKWYNMSFKVHYSMIKKHLRQHSNDDFRNACYLNHIMSFDKPFIGRSAMKAVRMSSYAVPLLITYFDMDKSVHL